MTAVLHQKHSFPQELNVPYKRSAMAGVRQKFPFGNNAVKTKRNDFATPIFRRNGQLRTSAEKFFLSVTNFLNFLI